MLLLGSAERKHSRNFNSVNVSVPLAASFRLPPAQGLAFTRRDVCSGTKRFCVASVSWCTLVLRGSGASKRWETACLLKMRTVNGHHWFTRKTNELECTCCILKTNWPKKMKNHSCPGAAPSGRAQGTGLTMPNKAQQHHEHNITMHCSTSGRRQHCNSRAQPTFVSMQKPVNSSHEQRRFDHVE